MTLRQASLLIALALGASMPLLAGPVPGTETFDKKAVDFPVSPSTEVWDIGNEEYLVTFKWNPGFKVSNAGVAGAFNNWNRTDLPMEGPDATGFYRVTARIKAGEYHYKFVGGADGWFTDPLNPANIDDNYGGKNSILRLGIYATIAGARAHRGDGNALAKAFLHDPALPLFVDALNAGEAVLRFRTLLNDVDSVTVKYDAGSGARTATMQHAASDAQYDYYEYHFHAIQRGKPSRRGKVAPVTIKYSFSATDATQEFPYDREFTLDLNSARKVDVPDWARRAIWYQVMVDRFRDGDAKNNPEFRGTEPVRDFPPQAHPWRSEWYTEFPYERENGQTFWKWSMYNRIYGGDFDGLVQKLDYIKSLGANAIYLNPVFEAQGSHKYNARNYVHADDGYGVPGGYYPAAAREDLLDASTWEWTESDKDLLRLIEETHKRGMKIIFDGVWNHVGDQHPAFLDVKEKRQQSRFADWFDIKSWEPFEYSGWGGFGGLPEFRKTESGLYSKSLVEHINNVTRRWMDPNGDGDPSDGIDGWRLDVPMHIPRPYWVEWRRLVKSINPEAYITGEIWDPAEYWLDGETFDAVMNYQFSQAAFRFFGNKSQKTTASQFDRELARLRIRYPRAINEVLMNLYDSHDTDRWVSRLANPDLPFDGNNRLQDNGPNYFDKKPGAIEYQRLRLMAMFQSTYIGAPMVWYGTEVGMFGADDPRNRMPMWWDDLMPYDSPDYAVDGRLRDYFRSLFALRSKNPVLNTGDYMTLKADDDKDCIAYLRYSGDSRDAFVVVLNNSSSIQNVAVPAPSQDILDRGFRSPKRVFGEGKLAKGTKKDRLIVTLPPVSGIVLKVRR